MTWHTQAYSLYMASIKFGSFVTTLLNQRLNIVGIDYVELLIQQKFRMTNKNLNCEANLYLNPPGIRTSPYLLHRQVRRNCNKKTFWLSDDLDFEWQEYIKDHVNTVRKYSLQIWQRSSSPANQKLYTTLWLSTVLVQPYHVRLTETFLFLVQTIAGKSLHTYV